ncbi:MAG TPA: cytochrome d ubiquinol oxidase subunit II [Capillimicrobium sp.]|nr:cytochrome d ubiquinol oxidase subunit II [Capillimicrobium sp.]
MEYTTLETVWFVLIGVLWTGYLVLEGFDFGVGMLLRTVGRTKEERRMVLRSIGPLWDGNEVWLLVAGGATFAAFPLWYATLFSGAYLALFLVLLSLIVRNVALEFWGKHDDDTWRARWEWAAIIGSALPAVLWGVAWANIIHGIPIGADGNATGELWDLLGPYALLGGVATLLLFLAHGATFLTLKTSGPVEERARAVRRWAGPAAVVALGAWVAWTLIDGAGVATAVLMVGAVALLAIASALRAGGWSFGATAGAIGLLVAGWFTQLFPHVLISSTDPAYSITLHQAASGDYTLKVMTGVAVVLVPIVLLYQGWTYWVFRKRLTLPAPPSPPAATPGD